MIESVSGVDNRSQQVPVSERENQTRRLDAYVQAGGGEPTPKSATLAEIGVLPIPLDQLQKVQALLAQTQRLVHEPHPSSGDRVFVRE